MRQQILYYLGLLIYGPLLPVLYGQGRRVRARVPRLPEAEGSDGRTAHGPGSLRLLTLGESTVAGVGVPHHREGFSGWLARHLSERTGSSVRWQALGVSGYTAERCRDELVPRIPAEPLDLIVIALGGNDTFRLHSPLRWKRAMIGLIEAIRGRQPDCPILVANLPPVRSFPAFTRTMRHVLGRLVELHGNAIRDLPRRFRDVHYAAERVRVEAWIERCGGRVGLDDLFCDGVHPSSLTYRLWGEELVDLVRQRGLLGLGPEARAGACGSAR